jgi:hypothetical protein
MRRIVLAGMVAVLVAAGMPRGAAAEQSYGAQMGWGTLAMGTNLLYMPAKLVYVVLGGMTGGLAYLLTFGNEEAANLVWSPSLGGTYVITPAMLRGEESILYSGESYETEQR